jgi:hypothetical protein
MNMLLSSKCRSFLRSILTFWFQIVNFFLAQIFSIKWLAKSEPLDDFGCLDYDTTSDTMGAWTNNFFAPVSSSSCWSTTPNPVSSGGREIEPEVLAGIFADLSLRFGNYTPLGVAGFGEVPGGHWEGQVEPSMRVEVSVLPERVPEVEQFVREIGARLRQKEMYFKAGQPCVKLLRIEPNLGKAADGGE